MDEAFFTQPFVSRWLNKAKTHCSSVEMKLRFAFSLHFKNERTKVAVESMGSFLVGGKRTVPR